MPEMIAGTPSVYFVQENGPSKLIKIGYSRQGAMRIDQVNAWCPYRAALLACVEGPIELETWFHEQLWAHRSHSEWFFPADAVLTVIEQITRAGRADRQPRYSPVFDGGKYKSNLPSVLERLSLSTAGLAAAIEIAPMPLYFSHPASKYGWREKVLSPALIHKVIEYGKTVGVDLGPEDFVIERTKRVKKKSKPNGHDNPPHPLATRS